MNERTRKGRQTRITVLFALASFVIPSAFAVNLAKCRLTLAELGSPVVRSLVELGYDEVVAARMAELYPNFAARLLALGDAAKPIRAYRGLLLDHLTDFDSKYLRHHDGALNFEINTAADLKKAGRYAKTRQDSGVEKGRAGMILELQFPAALVRQLRPDGVYVLDTRKLENWDLAPFIVNRWECSAVERAGFVRPPAYAEFMGSTVGKSAEEIEFLRRRNPYDFWVREINF